MTSNAANNPTREQLLRIVDALLEVRRQEIEYAVALAANDIDRCRELLANSQPARDAIDAALADAGFTDIEVGQ